MQSRIVRDQVLEYCFEHLFQMETDTELYLDQEIKKNIDLILKKLSQIEIISY